MLATTDLPNPKLPGLADQKSAQVFARAGELAAKAPQKPDTPAKDTKPAAPPRQPVSVRRAPAPMEYPDDPWNAPDVHKGHKHGAEPPNSNGGGDAEITSPAPVNGGGNRIYNENDVPGRTTSTFTTASAVSVEDLGEPERQPSFTVGSAPGGGWGAGFFDPPAAGDAPSADLPATSPFGGPGGIDDRDPTGQRPAPVTNRTLGSGRTGSAVEENVIVTLLPEKEGMFMFQHHNYEVSSSRRASKVIRRYSDFVWLLDCLHKRYPFRVLPLLPPKRVAGMFDNAST